MRYFTNIDGTERLLDVEEHDGRLVVRHDDAEREHDVDLVRVRGSSAFSLLLDGHSHPVVMAQRGGGVIDVTIGSRTYCVKVEDERTHEAMRLTGKGAAASGPTRVTAVMPGIVREVRVAPGDEVEAGTPLMILEAMKMQNEVRAPRAGRIKEVSVEPESVVAKNDLLAILDEPSQA